MASLAHIANGELGLSVRNKLNSLIDQYNTPVAFPSGGGTQGSVLFIDGTGAIAQDNAKFFWDDSADILKLLGTLALSGTTSGTVTVAPQAVAGTWTMKLPSSAGTNLYVLQTDGTGVTSWVPQSGGGGGGMAIGGAVTSGTTGSILFIDGSGNLGQDNTKFFWDDTNDALKIQGQNALYRVPNGAGDNWFEGGAGNFAVTGSNNFGTGAGTLGHLTSGSFNTGVGDGALFDCTVGSDNVAIGSGALGDLIDASGNFAIGFSALATLDLGGGTGSTANFAMGTNAMSAMRSGGENVGIGGNCLLNLIAGNGNVAIGFSPWGALTSGNYNLAIGVSAAKSFSSGSANTIIGPFAGQSITSGSSNTLIGGWEGPSGALSNIIAITDGSGAAAAHPEYINGVDYKYTTSNVWSFQNLTAAQGIHVYNTTDSGAPPTNYERGCFDWNLTSNVLRVASQKGGTGTVRLIAIDGFQKAGAPAAGDLPSGTWGVINDTSGGNTWLVYNNAGTIRKVQLT